MKQNRNGAEMKIIGITGGVGAGKTKVLSYIEEHFSSRIIRADEAAHMLELPGHECYDRLVKVLGQEVLDENGLIIKNKMAEIIFEDKKIIEQVNAIIHPAVKQYIVEEIEKEKKNANCQYFFIEAALLIEEHYEKIVDELWYIHTNKEIRAKRLQESRQYSVEKIESIMKGQLSEAEFRKNCQVVIENNDDLEITYSQIRKALGE